MAECSMAGVQGTIPFRIPGSNSAASAENATREMAKAPILASEVSYVANREHGEISRSERQTLPSSGLPREGRESLDRRTRPSAQLPGPPNCGPTQPIIVEETETASKRMKSGKAMGSDDLAAEPRKSLYRYCAD